MWENENRWFIIFIFIVYIINISVGDVIKKKFVINMIYFFILIKNVSIFYGKSCSWKVEVEWYFVWLNFDVN